MDFGQKTTLKGTPAIVGSHPGNIIQQVLVKEVKGLAPGYVVVITDGVITGRWNGTALVTGKKDGEGNITVTQVALGIVTARQFEGDVSVSTLRFGSYIRERIVLADGSRLSASNEFTLSLSHLFTEGAWT